MVAKAGAPLVVAFKYCPVVPLATEERVSEEEVYNRVLVPPKVETPVPP